MRFDQLLYNDQLLDALDSMRFEECTPIQEKSIPVIEDGYDLLALAQTGTGKTAAYLLPIIDRIADGGFPEKSVNCIVMVPTRELALQIEQHMQGFSYFLPQVSSVSIYGGTDGSTFETQKQALCQGVDVVIATPGRLLAHLQMGYVDLKDVSFFVLDEADRMLDMGFCDDILKILSYLSGRQQTLMFSATISPKIKKLADRLLVDPVEIEIALSKPPEKIDQKAYVVYERQKEAILRHILRHIPLDRVIIFSSSKLKVKQLSRTLRSWNIKSGEIHSDLDQARREETMLAFRAGRINVLVATDIVARGIDVDDISTVINYDVPHEAEDYVHRIGRTARAESSGRAITLISETERDRFRRIEQLIEKEVEKGEVPAELGAVPGYDSSRAATDNDRKKRRGRGGKPSHGRHSRHSRGDGSQAQASNKPHQGRGDGSQPRPTNKPHQGRGGADTQSKASHPASQSGSSSPKPNKKRRYYHRPKNKPTDK